MHITYFRPHFPFRSEMMVPVADPSTPGYSNGILYYEYNHENDVEGDSDSSASMETMSDNVSVWVDGEKHWVSGVDANTTCADLINALVNYQDSQLFALNQSAFTKEDNIDYVIVKQHQEIEEFLDPNMKILDILPLKDSNHKKEV